MFGITNNTDPGTGAQLPNATAPTPDMAAAAGTGAPAITGPGAPSVDTSMPTAAEVAANLSSSPAITSPAPAVAGSSSLEDQSSSSVVPAADNTAPLADPTSPSDGSTPTFTPMPDPLSSYTNYSSGGGSVTGPGLSPTSDATNTGTDTPSTTFTPSTDTPNGSADNTSPSLMDTSTNDSPSVPDTSVVGTPASSSPSDDNSAVASDDLLNIKQDVLSSLAPLVDHLEQTPEEKFRTTMMMIQASDNSSLVRDAYEAAKQITDEKARAQALLDVVNEINYFTHTGQNPAADDSAANQ
jgi:hypothetical protein